MEKIKKSKLKFMWVFHEGAPNKVTLTRILNPLSLLHLRALMQRNDPVESRFAHQNFKASEKHAAMAKPWQKRVADSLLSARYEGLGNGKIFKFVSFPGYDIVIERISPLVKWDTLLEIAESEIEGVLKNVEFKKHTPALKQTA
jgi:hypothetical protein